MLTIFTKGLVLDTCLGAECASADWYIAVLKL